MDYNCIRCPNCRQETNIDNDFCPFCGQNLKIKSHFGKAKKNTKRTLSIIAVLIIAVNIVPNIIMSRSFKDNVVAFLPKATMSSTFVFLSEDAEEILNKIDSFFEGAGAEYAPLPELPEGSIKAARRKKFTVGEDIPAGEYLLITLNPDDLGFLELTHDIFSYYDRDGEYVPEGVTHKNVSIAWELFETNYIITIQNGQTFCVEDCVVIPFASANQSLLPQNGTGMYKVGLNLDAGEYVLIRDKDYPLSDSHYEISTTSNGAYAHEIYSGYFKENAIITVCDDEYLYISGCHMVPIEEAEIDTSGSGTFKVGTHIDAGKYVVAPTDEEKLFDYAIYTDGRLTDENRKCYVYGENANNAEIELNEGEYIVLDYMRLIPQ